MPLFTIATKTCRNNLDQQKVALRVFLGELKGFFEYNDQLSCCRALISANNWNCRKWCCMNCLFIPKSDSLMANCPSTTKDPISAETENN